MTLSAATDRRKISTRDQLCLKSRYVISATGSTVIKSNPFEDLFFALCLHKGKLTIFTIYILHNTYVWEKNFCTPILSDQFFFHLLYIYIIVLINNNFITLLASIKCFESRYAFWSLEAILELCMLFRCFLTIGIAFN